MLTRATPLRGVGLGFVTQSFRRRIALKQHRHGEGLFTRKNCDHWAKEDKEFSTCIHTVSQMLSIFILGVIMVDGAAERNRTADLFITNELLYQLSYSGTLEIIQMTR